MPHKNSIRIYAEGYHYHIYNRGVEKRLIFINPEDYYCFLNLIDSYLTPPPPITIGQPIRNTPWWRSRLEDKEIEILCYCLMPNHFHFLIKQNTSNGITRFMRRMMNAYVRYFNQKYQRVGSLFQGKFKASIVENDPYLLHLSRYIHRNPLDLEVGPLNEYPYSSYRIYLENQPPMWLQKATILDHFSHVQRLPTLKDFLSYQAFVEDKNTDSSTILGELTLD